MIYYIEYDAAGNIYHAANNVSATITPLIPVAILKDAKGNLITPFADPVGITAAQYSTLITGGIGNFTYDPKTEAITKKVVPDVKTT